jgi:hypothetical protein
MFRYAERKVGHLSKKLKKSNPGSPKKGLVPLVGSKSETLRGARGNLKDDGISHRRSRDHHH